MEIEISHIAPYVVALVAFFVGRMIRNIEKKVDETAAKSQEHDLEIKQMDEKRVAMREANDKAQTVLADKMAELADEFKRYMKETSRINALVGIHTVEIKNLKDAQDIIARTISKKQA